MPVHAHEIDRARRRSHSVCERDWQCTGPRAYSHMGATGQGVRRGPCTLLGAAFFHQRRHADGRPGAPPATPRGPAAPFGRKPGGADGSAAACHAPRSPAASA